MLLTQGFAEGKLVIEKTQERVQKKYHKENHFFISNLETATT